MNLVVKIAPVKKLLCVLLIIWFGGLSSWAQMHATDEATHEIAHLVADGALTTASDKDHEEHCGLAHCCHSVAVLPTGSAPMFQQTGSERPAQRAMLRMQLPPPEIDRPKWALATHAVASF